MWNRDHLKLDAGDMLARIATLPDQLREGIELGKRGWKPLKNLEPAVVVVAGMGGSAIGAEVLLSYLGLRATRPILVCRDYRLPGFVDRRSLVIVSSYSGNTEEALACFDDAAVRGATIGVVCSGGKLRARADERGAPGVTLPGGYPPRAALGYSFASLLALAWEVGLAEPADDDLDRCIDTLRELTGVYSVPEAAENPAIGLAEALTDKVPIVYCENRLAGVALRWKGQFCENSKKPAFIGLLPELGHNEIMGWETGRSELRAGVIFLRIEGEHPATGPCFEFLERLLEGKAAFQAEFKGSGLGLLSQVFSLILLGDYASVYLALLRGLDPTPIETIGRMKSWLKKR